MPATPAGEADEPEQERARAPGANRYIPSAAFKQLPSGQRGTVDGHRRLMLQGEPRSKARLLWVDPEPVPGLGQPTALPAKLGGGWVFRSESHLYFAPTFDGPLALIHGGATSYVRVGLGHGQLLVTVDVETTLHELPSGKPIPLDPAGTVEMFGTPDGLVATRRANGELFVRTSAERAWTKVVTTEKADAFAYDGKGIVVRTANGRFRLGADAKLTRPATWPAMTASDNLSGLFLATADLSKPPPESPQERLHSQMTRLMTRDVAVAIDDRDLLFLDVKDASILDRRTGAFSRFEGDCFVVRGGTPSFVSCRTGEKLMLLRVDGPRHDPVIERELPEMTLFGSPHDAQALAFASPCAGAPDKGAPDKRFFCARTRDGKWQEYAVRAQLFDGVGYLVHTAASNDGRVYGFGFVGTKLRIIYAHRDEARTIDQATFPAWAKDWAWDELNFRKEGIQLTVNASPAGVLFINDDGTVDSQRAPAGTLHVSGRHGLLAAEDGRLLETNDGGRTLHAVAPPPSGASSVQCAPAGCTVGPWYRNGFDRW